MTCLRLIIVAFSAATFLLQNYYTADLTSYITAPNLQPLIKSANELYSRDDIQLIVFNDKNVDVTISVKEERTIFVLK